MKTLEELKNEIRREASDKPGKFFAVEVLRRRGFERSRCESCGLYFWSSDPSREVCGEPDCGEGYTFIEDSLTDNELSYAESWELFRDFMSSRGYEPLDRYPVVARWRNDVEFVGGSIYNFQPHVVSGEAEPPAPELVIPQPSLRFNDIDNVGITGRHYVLHDHIGQTCFRKSEEYDQNRYFEDMLDFATQKLDIEKSDLVLHEDAWGGGGNLGACMEFFAGGLELFNQVYMFYSQEKEGYEELDLKVLDMGMGHERITWISHGAETSYEVVMPDTLEKMRERTGERTDSEVWREFLPYSGTLNVDEVDDVEERWREIASEMGMEKGELKSAIRPSADLYAVAEHSRALLFALADGKLPSNTGGGHNLRVVYRRTRDLIQRHKWELDVAEVCGWHAEELKPLFPELENSMEEVKEILQVEKKRYEDARKRAESKLEGVENPSEEKIIELYESHGVSPEIMEDHGIEVPEDFYSMVSTEEEHRKEEKRRFNVESGETEKLYYGDENRRNCTADVEEALPNGWVVLDRTVFYPEGGGQEADRGVLRKEEDTVEVTDVQEQSGTVLHHCPGNDLERGDEVEAEIDWERRRQLMRHHTSTHMVNYAAREMLGDHIWQDGASKTVEKARLDVTHYRKLDRTQLDAIENRVKDLATQNLPVKKKRMKKSEAEQQYGFRLYQGGAAPGGELRVVSIDDIEHEACGGTHIEETSQIGEFVVTGSKKVQDGTIRIQYRAGEAAERYLDEIERRIDSVAGEMGIKQVSEEILGGTHREVQRELCSILSVDPENLENSVERFKRENRELKESIEELSDFLGREAELADPGTGTLVERVRELFEAWKRNEKTEESLESNLEHHIQEEMDDREYVAEVPTDNVGLLIQVARKLAKGNSASVTLKGAKGAVSASFHEEYDADANLERYASPEDIEGDENFAKTFAV